MDPKTINDLVQVTAANDPLISLLINSHYGTLVTIGIYYALVRYVCTEVAPLLPQAWRAPTSNLFVPMKVIDLLAGNYGSAKNAQAVGLLEGLVVRVLTARGLVAVPKPAPGLTATGSGGSSTSGPQTGQAGPSNGQ